MIHHPIKMFFIFKIYRRSVKWKFHFWMVFFFYRPSSLTAIHVPNVLTIVTCKKNYTWSLLSQNLILKQHFNKCLRWKTEVCDYLGDKYSRQRQKKHKCPKWRVYPVSLRNNQSVSFSETYKVQGREVQDENNITGVLGFREGWRCCRVL